MAVATLRPAPACEAPIFPAMLRSYVASAAAAAAAAAAALSCASRCCRVCSSCDRSLAALSAAGSPGGRRLQRKSRMAGVPLARTAGRRRRLGFPASCRALSWDAVPRAGGTCEMLLFSRFSWLRRGSARSGDGTQERRLLLRFSTVRLGSSSVSSSTPSSTSMLL